MASIVYDDDKPAGLGGRYSIARIALIGAVLGALYVGLTALLNNWTDSISMAGNIATVLVALIGIVVMVRLRMVQPLLVAVASAASLWGLSGLTDGLVWFETMAWAVALYCLAYALFSWISRYDRVVPVLSIIAMIIITIRIVIVS